MQEVFYKRAVDQQVDRLSEGFPVIVISGPRQSGKTTYIRKRFKEYAYFNLERLSDYEYITADIEGFLKRHPRNIILDEVQKVPALFSALQVHVDEMRDMGSVILSGSQNLLLSENISQSLAGRVAHIALYPFSITELATHRLLRDDVWEQIVMGGYPALYSRKVTSADFYNNYISTFIERDVRLIKNVGSLAQFKTFMVLLAGRVGQLVELSSLAADVGVSPNTIKSWISVLEASYVIFTLPPYLTNVRKRVVKSPKVYFHDTGVLCALLGIDSAQELYAHYARGSIFENFIITELVKIKAQRGDSSKLYFYRDNNKTEIDVVVDTGARTIPVEIKSARSFTKSFAATMQRLQQTVVGDEGFVIYTGERTLSLGKNMVVPWKDVDKIYRQE